MKKVPSAWPNCEFKDEFSCDPSTEITIPDWTGLIPENTKFILASSMKEINGIGQMKNEYVSFPPKYMFALDHSSFRVT